MKEEFDKWLEIFALKGEIDNDAVMSLCKSEKNSDMLKYVIQSKLYDVNFADKTSVTLLHVICGGDNNDLFARDIVKLLIDENVDINVVDDHGRTPLILAIDTDKSSTAEELIHQGACVKKIKDSLISPLMLCIKNELNELAVLLIRVGADINEIDNGNTPLSAAKDTQNEYLQGFLEGRGAIELHLDLSDTTDSSISDDLSDDSVDIDEIWFKTLLPISPKHE